MQALREVAKHKYLFLLGLPGMLYFIVFKYFPMYGILVAFQDYSPITGFAASEWVGFEHFQRLFEESDFWLIFRNSLVISVLSIVFLFPAPIFLALLLNEVQSQVFKRTTQTIIYFPHFLSWVVVVSLSFLLLSSEQGLINKLIAFFGGERVSFLMRQDYFYPIILLQGLWKDVGWGTIIYLAAIAGVNPSLYEAAKLDGANKLKQILHVTIPSITPTILILFILSLGSLLEVNFEQLWLMQNPLVTDIAEVFDTYVYKVGVRGGEFSYSTAVGIFKSVIGLVLILLANRWANRKGHEGVW
jgi:putative aldouronate transport system permease protein